jgi:hypothetical protein
MARLLPRLSLLLVLLFPAPIELFPVITPRQLERQRRKSAVHGTFVAVLVAILGDTSL